MGIKFITMLWNLCQRFENNDNEYFENLYYFFYQKYQYMKNRGGTQFMNIKELKEKHILKNDNSVCCTC